MGGSYIGTTTYRLNISYKVNEADRIYYAHKDHLGSIVSLTDANGAEVFKAEYDAWGNRTVTNNTFKFDRGYGVGQGVSYLTSKGINALNLTSPLIKSYLPNITKNIILARD